MYIGKIDVPHSKRRSAVALPHLPMIEHRALGYRQVQVLRYIYATIEIEGAAPSQGDIRRRFDMDRANVSQMITAFERRGLLKRVGDGRVRRIALHNCKASDFTA